MTGDIMLEQLDFWLAVGVLGMLAWAKFGRHIAPLAGVIMSRLPPKQPTPDHYAEPPKRADLADTHQADTLSADDLIDQLIRHNLTREQAIKLLSQLKNPLGDHWLSANKIAGAVGGTNAETMAAIAEYRPRPSIPHPPQTMRRPRNGW